jgi:DNA polymerase I-like protein with 3'-5' exonuclease and polymerase domains
VAKILDTSRLSPSRLSAFEREQIYNGLDCCITSEVYDVLRPQLDTYTNATYEFSKELQGPVLEMRLRGVLVDQQRRLDVLERYHEKLDQREANLERIVREGIGMVGFNWRSPPQLQELFYGRLRIPPIRRQGKVTVNREALERMEQYLIARPIISHMQAMRDIGKKIGVLRTEIDSDGRMRTSYNIGGTDTGRLSSSLSEFGTGGNLQNIEDLLRSVLIADPGMKMGYFDAEQGESRVVGAIEFKLFNDSRYLDACESGDLHTTVARLVWPKLGWTGDLAADKALAEQVYYRHYSRRFMCKKIGHGTNYAGKPYTLAEQAKVDIELIQEFQPKYFQAFPAHLRWHAWVEGEVQKNGMLINLTRRKRQFWGRRNDPATIREAIAYDPQGSLADIVNSGMLQVWRSRSVQLLMQVHDAIVVQYPEEKEDEIIPLILSQLRYPLNVKGREFIIPYGAKTGFNFGEYNEKANPFGLKSWKGGDKRKRPKEVSILDREFC